MIALVVAADRNLTGPLYQRMGNAVEAGDFSSQSHALFTTLRPESKDQVESHGHCHRHSPSEWMLAWLWVMVCTNTRKH